ncbi:RNA-directed DNA polymerase, eukaryota, reverse transcriptase zinc-binding domain protein, partial [Tanacetum coccineum]
WDPSVSLDIAEPNKLPLWVKLRNLPLEAWSTKGISVVASRPRTVEEFMEMEIEELKKKQDSAECEQVMYKLVEKEETNEGDKTRNEVEKEQMIDKGSPKTGWNVQHDIIDSIRKSANKYVVLDEENEIERLFENGNEVEKEVKDVYEETSGSARNIAHNEIGSSYVEVLNGKGGGGWDKENIQCMIVHATDQVVLCLFEIQDHSERISCMTHDMKEFKDCINAIRMDDICSSGLHYTWIKSLLNPNTSILNKIDRVMCNEEFLEVHLRAHVIFLPSDKDEFLGVIKDKWKTGVEGFAICKVEEICGEDNVRYAGDQVPTHFVKHFQMLLGDQNKKECLDIDDNLFSKKIDNQEACRMIIEVSNEEIKDAMFDTNDNKALGPDGFTAKFFKKSWEVIGEDVCKVAKEFFIKGKILGEFNSTLITLVPKVSTPNKVSDFRPIACCNVVYKCISKIITNRIKNALDNIYNKNQSTFVPKRQIIDNILLTQELLKGYDCVMGPKRCSMKIDIQKAYDTVKWKFLENA